MSGALLEDAEAQVDEPGLLLVERPCEAEARSEVCEAVRIGQEEIAQAYIDRKTRSELDGVLKEEGHAELCERDKRIPAGELIGGGIAAGQVEQGAAILLDPADGRGFAGGIVVGVEDGRAASTEDVGAVESVGVVVVQEEGEGLRAELKGVLAVGEHDVVVDFEIALAVVEVLAGGAASYKVAGDLECGIGRERSLLSALPGVADTGFVQQIGAGSEGVGKAEIIFVDQTVVASFGKDEAPDSLIAEIVDVG